MTDARQAILGRLEKIPVASTLGSAARSPWPLVAGPSTRELDALVEAFAAALGRLSASWEMAESPVSARLSLAGRLQDEGIGQLLSWASDQLPVPGLLEALEVLEVMPSVPNLRPGLDGLTSSGVRAQRQRLLAELELVELGLTGADAAFANTGTLVLCSGPGRPRLVSQLVRRHIVLLAVSRLFPSMEAWLANERAPGTGRPMIESSNITFITGPSRTLDIELFPAHGIHGPRWLHVILVQGI